jgi:glycine/D-amino acid oxidase-like deaminating enzyme/nitrite reductase/ring-hydroxylating ferredoxin subunit
MDRSRGSIQARCARLLPSPESQLSRPSTMDLPGLRECCWTACAPETDYPALRRSGASDVVVVGAGIVGLTTAYLLAVAGIPVTVVEARKIGRQVTGRSTAKVTSQHTLIYRHLIRKRGTETARLYADANATAVRKICEWARVESIACDLEIKDAYAYTCRAARRAAIDSEAEAARSLGLDAESLDSAPLPFATVGALRFRNQAQFNPTRYLIGLAAAVKARGGRIFENTRVTDVKSGKRWRVTAGRHHLAAGHVVLATNLPIAGPIHFDEITQPRSHVAMAFRASPDGTLDGMFIDIDRPAHSLRMGEDADGPLLIVLGAKFRTGQEGDVAGRFRQLKSWVRSNVPAGAVAWRWVNEDYDTSDRIPYAGAIGRKAPGLYVATGFNAWGISNGTAAGMTIADQIRGRPNPWAQLYDPARKAPKHFNRGGDTKSLVHGIEQIPLGGGGVIKRGKEKIAIWRSPGGKLKALSASCTHMGCTVTWNNADLTWDCPCHGSMFSYDGAVIHGPATEALPRKILRWK